MPYFIIPKVSFVQFLNLDLNNSFGEYLELSLFDKLHLQIKKDNITDLKTWLLIPFYEDSLNIRIYIHVSA